jgi:hypothetical protein
MNEFEMDDEELTATYRKIEAEVERRGLMKEIRMKFQIWCTTHDSEAKGDLIVWNGADGYVVETERLHCEERFSKDGDCNDQPFMFKISGDQVILDGPKCSHPEYKDGYCAEMICRNYYVIGR